MYQTKTIIIATPDQETGRSVVTSAQRRGITCSYVQPEESPQSTPSPSINQLLAWVTGSVVLILDPIYLPQMLENISEESGKASLIHQITRGDVDPRIISPLHRDDLYSKNRKQYELLKQIERYGIRLRWLQKPLFYGDIGTIVGDD